MVEKLICENLKRHSVEAVAAVGNYIAEHASEIVGVPFEFIEDGGFEMSIEFKAKHAIIHVRKKEAQVVDL